GVAEEQESDAEQDKHDADLDGRQDAGEGSANGAGGFGVEGDGGSLEEAAAGFGLHIGGQLLAGGELVDEAAVNLGLELEDAVPAAAFDEHAHAPDSGDEEAGKGEQRGRVAEELVKAGPATPGLVDVGPYGVLEGFVGSAGIRGQVGEEIKARIAGHLGMRFEECGELRVVVADVILIGEQGWVVRHHSGEGGAEAEQLDELALGCGEVLVGLECLRWGGRRLRGRRAGRRSGVGGWLLGRGRGEGETEETGEPKGCAVAHGGYLVRCSGERTNEGWGWLTGRARTWRRR